MCNLYNAFTIDSSTPTSTPSLKKHPLHYYSRAANDTVFNCYASRHTLQGERLIRVDPSDRETVTCVPSECVSVRHFQIFIVLLNLSKLGTYRAAEVAIYKIDEDTTNIVSSQMDVVFSTYNNSQSLASTIHL
jgi:hypothetical protein